MERKTFDIEIKDVNEDKGEVTAYLAVFGNIDHQGDRIAKGAFSKSIQARPSIPMISQHLYPGAAGNLPANQVVVGKWNLSEDDHGLLGKGKVNLKTQAGREHFELLKAGDLNKFSIGYQPEDADFESVEGKSVRNLKQIALYEGSVVIFPANDEAVLLGVKADMSTADINDLPDSDFAYIEPGGEKDEEGKTKPRSLRHFPIHDAAHVRNALARASQSPFGPKAMPKIRAAAKRFGIDVDDDEKFALHAIEANFDAAAAWLLKFDAEMETKAGSRNSAADQSRIQLVHDMAHQMADHTHALGAQCDYDGDDDGDEVSTMDLSRRYLPISAKDAAEMVARIVVSRI